MEFIKRNILLVSVALVTLAGCLILAVAIVKTGNASAEKLQEMEKQRVFLRGLRTHNFAITPGNSLTMKANRSLIHDELRRLKRMLASSFTVPHDDLQAVRFLMRLREEIGSMQQDLDDKNIMVRPTYFSFQQVATEAVLPSDDRVSTMWRQVYVIKEVVRLAGAALAASEREVTQAGLKPSLAALDRLSGDQFVNRSEYEFLPLRVQIVAPLDKVQSFINKINRESKYLFFVRKVSLQAQDQVGSLKLPKPAAVEAAEPDEPDPLDMQRQPGIDPTQPPKLQPLPLKDRVVFKQHWVSADIRLDFVQFAKPEES